MATQWLAPLTLDDFALLGHEWHRREWWYQQ